MLSELQTYCSSNNPCGFLPACTQIANVSALPGIVGASLAMPDVHSGYGFSIGNVAAFDMNDPSAVVSPGGVGFDINCGVRLLRTNLFEKDIEGLKEKLAQTLFDHIPVGVGTKGVFPTSRKELDSALEMGMDWSLREGYAWAEDKVGGGRSLGAAGRGRVRGDCTHNGVIDRPLPSSPPSSPPPLPLLRRSTARNTAA